MEKTLRELAEYVHGEVVGDENITITAVAGIEEAEQGQITFLANPKYRAQLQQTKASAVIVSPNIEIPGIATIQVKNPYLAFAQVLSLFSEKKHPPVGNGYHTSVPWLYLPGH